MRLQLIALAVAVSLAPHHVVADEGDWQISADSLVYSDTDNVVIISPQLSVHKPVDEDGGSATARVVVDAVSAASVDVVSQATNRFSEIRSEVDLSFAKRLGQWLPSMRYRYSHEPDYQSQGFGGGFQRRLGGADTTLALDYDLSLDTVGYHGTPTSAFSESLTSQTVAASLTQVLNPEALVRFIYTLTVMNGYMEKPYRFVPMFDEAGIAAAMSDGVKIDLSNFDEYRLALRPAEEVPDQRVGHAFGIRLMRYLDGLPGSFRVDMQYFRDSWQVQAFTLEPAVQWKRSDRTTLAFYGRLYLQSAAEFWQREYVVVDGQVPEYRTLDRDLSDYYVATGGARWQWQGDSLTLYADASVMETVYGKYLFLDSRTALISQAGLRWSL